MDSLKEVAVWVGAGVRQGQLIDIFLQNVGEGVNLSFGSSWLNCRCLRLSQRLAWPLVTSKPSMEHKQAVSRLRAAAYALV